MSSTEAQSTTTTFNHPMRLAIVEAVIENERLSPKEIADKLGVPLGNASYHVRELTSVGILKAAGKRPVRGALQHFYRVDRDALNREVNDLAAFVARLAVLGQDAADRTQVPA